MSALAAYRRRLERDPLRHMPWLPLQHAFLSDPRKFLLLRAGNQFLGKTTAGLARGIYHARGDCPFYAVPPPPVFGAIVCTTHSQSIEIQTKLWNLLPKSELHPSTEFIPGYGFRGQFKAVRWLNGSITYILTSGQGAPALASRTLHWIHEDEPPKTPRTHMEAISRVAATNGYIWMTFTPVNAPTGYLRDQVDAGVMHEHWSPLTPEAVIPVGHSEPRRGPDGVPWDAEYLEYRRSLMLPREAPVVADGEWDMSAEGQVFYVFDATREPGSHVSLERPEGEFDLRVGADHGSGFNFSACGVLVGSQRVDGVDCIYVLDEYVSDGETDSNQDGAGLVAMLDRWDQHWNDLRWAYGDRPWQKNDYQKKDNKRLFAAVRQEYKRRRRKPPTHGRRFHTVKRGQGHGAGSVSTGLGYLHRAMVGERAPGGELVRQRFYIQPGCTRVIEALSAWEGKDDEYKHIIDALRYALDDLIFARNQGPVNTAKLRLR